MPIKVYVCWKDQMMGVFIKGSLIALYSKQSQWSWFILHGSFN